MLSREWRMMTLEDMIGQAARHSSMGAKILKLIEINKSLKSKINRTSEKEAKI